MSTTVALLILILIGIVGPVIYLFMMMVRIFSGTRDEDEQR